MDFQEWWMRIGRLVDPEPSAHCYDKRKDLMLAAWEAAKAQSSNYVCDTVERPSRVTFANGRTVEVVGNVAGTFLEIGWAEGARVSPSQRVEPTEPPEKAVPT